MNSTDIEKLMKLAAGGEMIFIGPFSQTSRFVDHFKVDAKRGPMAVLDNDNEIPLAINETKLKDFALTMRLT